ncbi:BrnT family toxin [Romeria aff. gracilis LEGE 07310]|uniref:BrnT family toxin n=1 Tax=Vasconcelosia minhoensis LEGE 07310 TaxID=915328 RepID=A0A8J7DBC1_9CYAN|nr:BrnT family toxin [Romeria gracilis]MBE9076193.1 BrnT family toxin [Romeria aff. gracilis LEGE 07310]
MRIRWDEAKRQKVLAERNIDFNQLDDLLYNPYLEDRRSEIPELYRIIGFTNEQLTTYIVEYRMDEIGEYIWVITAWKSTKQERKSYEQQIY